MSPEVFNTIVARLHAAGLAQSDIDWSENVSPPSCAEDFAAEAIFVICNSGMKNTVATRIFNRVEQAVVDGRSASEVFGHKLKAGAIDSIWRDRETLFTGYLAAPDKVAYCETLPHIGGITKYHLAKNFGADVAKPDVHLQRLADIYGLTVQGMCEALAKASGFRTATVDVLIWRACATGVMDSHTGEITESDRPSYALATVSA